MKNSISEKINGCGPMRLQISYFFLMSSWKHSIKWTSLDAQPNFSSLNLMNTPNLECLSSSHSSLCRTAFIEESNFVPSVEYTMLLVKSFPPMVNILIGSYGKSIFRSENNEKLTSQNTKEQNKRILVTSWKTS